MVPPVSLHYQKDKRVFEILIGRNGPAPAGLEPVLSISKITPELMGLFCSLGTSVGILYICCHSTLGSWVLASDLASFR